MHRVTGDGAGFFQHSHALVESGRVGQRTRVWAFAHVLPGAIIGEDCNICDAVFIENDVVLGDRVTVKCGVQLWDGVTLEDDVFVGPNATFTNDPFPRSKQYPERFARTVVRKGAAIGANATLLPGITIGAHAMVGAGAVVTSDVPPHAIVVGNPARVTGFIGAVRPSVDGPADSGAHNATPPKLRVRGPKLFRLPVAVDARGALSFAEMGTHLPFVVKRFFLIYDVKEHAVRGDHAHRTLHQYMVCVHGSCTVVLDDGVTRDELVLSGPDLGIHVPPIIWVTQYRYSADAVMLVLASDLYDEGDYVGDYGEFQRLAQAQ